MAVNEKKLQEPKSTRFCEPNLKVLRRWTHQVERASDIFPLPSGETLPFQTVSQSEPALAPASVPPPPTGDPGGHTWYGCMCPPRNSPRIYLGKSQSAQV